MVHLIPVSVFRRRDRADHRAGLALAARERQLCEVHRRRRGAVRIVSSPKSSSKIAKSLPQLTMSAFLVRQVTIY